MIDGTYTLINLIQNASFEGTGWNGGSYTSITDLHYGLNNYTLTGTTSTSEVCASTVSAINLNSTHLYYGRFEIFSSIQTTCDMYWPIAEPSLFNGVQVPANTWTIVSGVNNRSTFSSTASDILRIDFNNNSISGTATIDGAMLIDLTASFGASNEPTKEWLDSNIAFFEGSISIVVTDKLKLRNGDILNYSNPGPATITLPAGTYNVECWGAQGGDLYNSTTNYGGPGGYIQGQISLSDPTLMFLTIGGKGNNGLSTSYSGGSYIGGLGGYGGGGNGCGSAGAGGGGASAISLLGHGPSNAYIIAAAGGGACTNSSYANNSSYFNFANVSTASYSYITANQYGGCPMWGTSDSYYYDGHGGGGGWHGGLYLRGEPAYYGYGGQNGYNNSYFSSVVEYNGITSLIEPDGTSSIGHRGNGHIRITAISVIPTINMRSNIGGSWKDSSNVYVKINNTWVEATGVYSNIGGEWKSQ